MELESEKNLSDCNEAISTDHGSGLSNFNKLKDYWDFSYQERNQGPTGFLIKMHL